MICVSIVAVGLIGTTLTTLKNSILLFWFLGVEIAYVLVFPQLICVLFVDMCNGYGVVVGLLAGLVSKLLNGDSSLGLTPVIRYPGCTLDDGVYVQCAPVRTITMLTSLVATIFSSYLAYVLFNRGLLPEKLDVFQVKVKPPSLPLTPVGVATENNESDALNRNDLQG